MLFLAEKCHGLQKKVLYPMVSSTAARTSMKLIKACSFKTSLQFLCCQTLRRIVPSNLDVLKVVELPPGLRAFLDNNLSWLFRPSELSESALASKRNRHDRNEFGCQSNKRHRLFGLGEGASSSSSCDSSDSDDDDDMMRPKRRRTMSLMEPHEREDSVL